MDARTTAGKKEEMTVSETIRKSIQDLIFQKNLSVTDIKNCVYTVSSKFKEMEAPKYLKSVIDKIAYDDPTHSVTIISTIIQNILDQHIFDQSATDPKFKILSEIVANIKNKLKTFHQNEEKDVKELTEFLTFITKPLLELKKNNEVKKNAVTKELDLYCQELITWLDGLYLHFSIVVRRKEYQQAIKVKDAPGLEKALHPVKEKNTLISLAEKAALENLSKADVKEVQALILMVLHEIKRKPSTMTEETVAAMQYCLQVFVDENEVLNKGYLEQLEELTKSKDKIIPDLTRFLLELKKFPKNIEFFEHYKELAFLLEAKYYEAYKDKNNLFNLKDTMIRKKTNGTINRMLIAEHYHLAALILEELVLAKKIVQKEIVKPPIEVTPVKSVNKKDPIAQLHSIIATVEDPRRFLLLTEITQFIANMPLHDEVNLFKVILRTQEALMPQPFISERIRLNSKLDEEAFWALLNEASESDPRIKIEALLNAISKYELSQAQIERLAYLNKMAASGFKSYENNKYLWQKAVGYIPVVANVIDPILQRANADIVNRILGYFETEKDKHTILQNLFIERACLLDRCSQEALDIVNSLLLSVYNHLHNLLPASKMKKEEGNNDFLETYAKLKEQTFFGLESKKPESLPKEKMQLNV